MLTLAVLAATAAAPAAHAAWSVPGTLARPAAEHLAAAGNAQGDEVFAWAVTTERFLRSRDRRSGFASYIRARVRLADGTLGSTRAISSTKELVANPAVALDARGNATAVWTQAGRHHRIMVSFRPRDGRFGTPVEIGRTGAFITSRPQVVVSSGGAAVIAWNAGRQMRVVRRPAGRCRAGRPRGCFGAPQDFGAGSDQTLAMSADGNVYLVWAANVREGDDFHTRLRIAVAARGRRFGHSEPITRSGDASQPAVAITPDGHAIVAWRGSLPAGGEQNSDATIFAAARDRLGRLSAPQAISLHPGYEPQIAANPQGEAILVWNERDYSPQNPDGAQIAAAVRAAGGGAFGSPVKLSGPNIAAGSAALAIDASGTATIVYSAAPARAPYSNGGPVAVSHRRAPGAASFAGPEALPAEFTGALVFAAGARVTAASGGSGGRTLISDYAP